MRWVVVTETILIKFHESLLESASFIILWKTITICRFKMVLKNKKKQLPSNKENESD